MWNNDINPFKSKHLFYVFPLISWSNVIINNILVSVKYDYVLLISSYFKRTNYRILPISLHYVNYLNSNLTEHNHIL